MSPSHWATSAKEYREREVALYDAMPLLTRCAACEWTHLGDAISGREEALQHRLQAHPDLAGKRRRNQRHLASFRQQAMNAEEEAEIMAERARRARLHGLELSEDSP